MREVNILNGDCAYQEWRKAGLSGEVLVWRENYLQGTLPRTTDVTEFNRVRARELHSFAPERSIESIAQELDQMHQSLLALEPCDCLILWFDVCPFDRVMLARILWVLSTMETRPGVKLICRDVAWSAAYFTGFQNQGIVLHKEDFDEAAEQWNDVVNGAVPDKILAHLIGKCNRGGHKVEEAL